MESKQPFAAQIPPLPDLAAELRKLVAQIPRGRVTTYGRLAEALGSIHAAKWIAAWLIEEPATKACPTHRVVRADGSVVDYRKRPAADHAHALQADGVEVVDGRVDLGRHLFDDFQSTAPLQELAEWQTGLADQVSLILPTGVRDWLQRLSQGSTARDGWPDAVGGVDVSYITPTRAVAAYVLIDFHSRELIWSLTHEDEVRFPFISGFLSLRELPLILPLLDEVQAKGRLSPVLFVDGHGTLHRRRIGIASHLGIATGLSTVGIGKTLHLGTVDPRPFRPGDTRPILHEEEIVGTALRPMSGSKPVYLSPGHAIDLTTATELVCHFSQSHRLPTPTYWADKVSRQAVREIQRS